MNRKQGNSVGGDKSRKKHRSAQGNILKLDGKK